MQIEQISIWGDSIGKAVVFDEARGRYAICRDNYALRLREEGLAVENHSVMGYTVCQAAQKLREADMRPGRRGRDRVWRQRLRSGLVGRERKPRRLPRGAYAPGRV